MPGQASHKSIIPDLTPALAIRNLGATMRLITSITRKYFLVVDGEIITMFLPKTPFSKSNHFGLSLNATAIRAVSVNTQGEVISQAELTFNAPVLGDKIDHPDVLVKSLIQVKQQGNFATNYAAISIPEKYAFSRAYAMPKIDRSEITEALSWQLEKIFPFSKKEIYTDWKLLSETKDGTHILVTAIQRQFLDQLKNCLQAAEIYPVSFEPSASALSRLIPPQKDTSLIILELDNHGTTATLVRNGISSLTATTIINRDMSPEKVFQDIQDSIVSLASHLKTKYKSTAPKINIILTGEKASQQTANLLKQQLKYSTSVFQINNITPAYHLAYVAANTNVEPPESAKSINLLPTNLQEYFQAKMNNNSAQAAIKAISGLVIGAVIISGLALLSTQLLIGQANRNIAAIQAATPSDPNYLNLAQVNQKASRFVRLFDLKTTPESQLTTIIGEIPEGITVTNILYDSAADEITLTGVSKSRADILNLKTLLEGTDLITPITLPLSALESTRDFNFTVRFNLKPKLDI